MKKLTPAAQAALRAIFQTEPVSVYINRGSTGFAKPRIKLYGPPQLRRQTFELLKALGYIRLLGQDDLKELWDISEDGLAVLVEVDPKIARIEPTFQKRRLETPFETFGYDGVGLMGRRNSSSTTGGTPSVVGPWAPPDQFVETENKSTPRALSCAENVLRKFSNTGIERVTLGNLANGCLEIIEEYLTTATGSIRADIILQATKNEGWGIQLKLVERSFDANVPEYDLEVLNRILSKLSKKTMTEETNENSVIFLVSTSRRKSSKKIGPSRIPSEFSIVELIDRIRSAVVEIRPDRLSHPHVLRCRFAERQEIRNRKQCVGVVDFAWEKEHGSYYVSMRKQLGGAGSIKANSAFQKSANEYFENIKLTVPPFRSLKISLPFETPAKY